MSERQPRFEIVRTDAGWHARFRAANGRIVWTTENYQRVAKARNAIALIAGPIGGSPWSDWPEVQVAWSDYPIEVRDFDERTDRSRPGLGTAGVTGAQPDEPASQAGRPVAGGGS